MERFHVSEHKLVAIYYVTFSRCEYLKIPDVLSFHKMLSVCKGTYEKLLT